jgi:hypothetical protein
MPALERSLQQVIGSHAEQWLSQRAAQFPRSRATAMTPLFQTGSQIPFKTL